MDSVETEDDDWSPDAFRKAVTSNLQEGRFALYIVVDEVNPELRRIVDYLNAQPGSGLQLFALELKYFKDEGAEIVLPRLYGVSEPRRPGPASEAWSEERFRGAAATAAPERDRELLLDLVDFFKGKGWQVQLGKGKDHGRMVFRVSHPLARNGALSVFRLRSDGRMKMGFGRITRELPEPTASTVIQDILKAIRLPSVQRWFDDTYAVKGKVKSGWPGPNRRLSELLPDKETLDRFKTGLVSWAEDAARDLKA